MFISDNPVFEIAQSLSALVIDSDCFLSTKLLFKFANFQTSLSAAASIRT